MAGKKGMAQSRPTTNAERDKLALARLETWIDEILDGHVTCTKCQKEFEAKELQPSAVALLKARYDKLRPTLSAVEQTNHEASRTQEQILSEIRALLTAKPDLLATLLPGFEIRPTVSNAQQPALAVENNVGGAIVTH